MDAELMKELYVRAPMKQSIDAIQKGGRDEVQEGMDERGEVDGSMTVGRAAGAMLMRGGPVARFEPLRQPD